MLPLPGSPASSWARFRERFKAIFSGADPRVCIAFWLFGKIDGLTGCPTEISIAANNWVIDSHFV